MPAPEATEATHLSPSDDEVQAKDSIKERVSLKLKQKLEELGFNITVQDTDSREKDLVRSFSGVAQFVAAKDFEVNGKTNTAQIAFTPLKGYNNNIVFSARTYLNGREISGNHDFNSGELTEALINLIVMAAHDVPYEELSWEDEYIQMAQKLRVQLEDIKHLSWSLK